MTYTVYARNSSRVLKGTIPYLTLKLRLVYRGVGAWSLTMDPDHPKAALLSPGSGIVVRDDATGVIILSGPVRTIEHQADAPSGDSPAKDTLTISGVDDNWILTTRLAYPDPSSVASSQGAEDYYTLSDDAETVMRTLVDLNAAPGALTAREVAGLTLESDLERGPVVKASTRFDQVIEPVTAAALAGGLGWRIVHADPGTNLVFKVFEPTDRSATVRFSRELGNLRAYTYSLTGPTATRAIVGGGGEGTARTFVERADTAAEAEWGARVEMFVDRRDSSDGTTIEQAGDEKLAETSPTTSLSISPIDTPNMRFGQHYYLGDIVTVHIRGVAIADVVREIVLTATAEGVTAEPVVGNDGATNPATPRIFAAIRDLTRRLGQLEQRR